jgi:hypothetical protein
MKDKSWAEIYEDPAKKIHLGESVTSDATHSDLHAFSGTDYTIKILAVLRVNI